MSKNNNKEKSVEFYDNLRNTEWKYNANIGPSVRSRYRIIGDLISKYKLSGILNDTGCGTGNLLKYLDNKYPQRFRKIYGSDFSKEAIKLAEKLNPEIDINILDLVNPDAKYISEHKSDVIICSEVLEHIENDKEAINTLSKLTNSGGHVIISVPFLTKNWTQHDDFSGHVRRYEPEELENKIGKHFEVLESFGWGNFIYEFYYKLLGNISPKVVMGGGKPKFHKRFVAWILFQSFRLEDFFKSKKNGRRIFLIAKKL